MDKAKQIAREFLSSDGKHKTTVDQDVRGAATEEHVHPEKHENVTAAVDRDVHQEHHQTRIQPVADKQVLPETHSHNVLPVEEKVVQHGNAGETRQNLERDAAQYKDTSTTHSTKHSVTENPTMGGERTHHHVHEHIQPVIEKETIQPHVVHTTAPVHETHHAAPIHHETTTLPTKTMSEFSQGADESGLGSKAARTLREYEGCPQPSQENHPGAQRLMHGGEGGVRGGSSGYGENLTGNTGEAKQFANTRYGENLPPSAHERSAAGDLGASNTRNVAQTTDEAQPRFSQGMSSGGDRFVEENLAGKKNTMGMGDVNPQARSKPSLKDRLNPRKDADDDGKAGLFD